MRLQVGSRLARGWTESSQARLPLAPAAACRSGRFGGVGPSTSARPIVLHRIQLSDRAGRSTRIDAVQAVRRPQSSRTCCAGLLAPGAPAPPIRKRQARGCMGTQHRHTAHAPAVERAVPLSAPTAVAAPRRRARRDHEADLREVSALWACGLEL